MIAAGCTAVSMLLGILLALMIYKTGKREGSIFRFIFYSPSMIPMTVAGLLFVFVLSPDDGLLNNLFVVIAWDQCSTHGCPNRGWC